MTKLPAKGIDISEFNGQVDLAAMKDQIDFVIIRCGYGGDYSNQDDSQFEANVTQCQALGIPWGTYLYSYAKNTAMAQSEAQHTLRLLKGRRPPYGVWYDVEDSSLPTGEALVDNVVTYCKGIQEAGYYCGIYSFLFWMQTRLDNPRLDGFDKWVAQWNDTLDYNKPYGMWQFTDQWVINGKSFDGDWAYRDYPQLTSGKGEEDMTQEEVVKLARAEAQKVYEENETRYKTMASVPEWARAAVEQVYSQLQLAGTGSAGADLKLDASNTYVRVLQVIAKVLEQQKNGSPNP